MHVHISYCIPLYSVACELIALCLRVLRIIVATSAVAPPPATDDAMGMDDTMEPAPVKMRPYYE